MIKRYRVTTGRKIRLRDWDPNDRGGFPKEKDKAEAELDRLREKLADLQKLLYAGHSHRVLVVLQAMDTGGKDGTVRHVFSGVNPQGCRVTSFKAPNSEELDRDYLWRIHQHTPRKGEIAIFNRSHYEDVLAVRVLKLAPKKVWSRRFDHINAFERMLSDEGTLILKFFLHISREEQRKRLNARLDAPDKLWKFDPADLDTRKLWPEYTRAYEDVLRRTSTPWAPWHIVPANRKLYRNLVVARALVDALVRLDMRYPKPAFDPKTVRVR